MYIYIYIYININIYIYIYIYTYTYTYAYTVYTMIVIETNNLYHQCVTKIIRFLLFDSILFDVAEDVQLYVPLLIMAPHSSWTTSLHLARRP